MSRIPLCVLVAILSVAVGGVWAQEAAQTPGAGKKIIEYGWDVPTPSFIAEHIREMEQRPFDGLIFRLEGGNTVFDPVAWDPAKFQADYEALPKIAWQKFTDNFAIMLAASDQDWFDDAHWTAIEHNTRIIAKGAKLANCVGICFDAEPYGTNPWSYIKAAHHDTQSFEAYEAMARKRGSQFMRAVEQELPNPKILTFFLNSYFLDFCSPMPAELRQERISKQYYALLPAFLEGMLEVSGPGAQFIDGNEEAYYYTNKTDYLNVYHGMTQRVRAMVDPALWPAYQAKVRPGQALYVDQYFGLRQTEKTYGNFMPPEEQAKWMAHNTYWALYTTDTYVWCYSERMNWWKNTDIPEGCEQAIRSARAANDSGRRLRFDLGPIIQAAKERAATAMGSQLVRRKAEVFELAKGMAAPAIDGDLGDPAWRDVPPLEPFVTLMGRTSAKLEAQTEVRIQYDPQCVYVAFRCQEPKPGQLIADAASEGSESIFWGDVVEFFAYVSPSDKEYCHFAVNPKNAGWTSLHKGQETEPLSAKWEHAARIDKDGWTVEMAVPWQALGYTGPSPKINMRANFARQRGQAAELSSWRSMNFGFLEPDNFGLLVFE